MNICLKQQAEQRDLLASLGRARDRLDRGVELMERALDLQEQLGWQLDLGDMRAEVAAFVRDCHAFRRERNHGR